VGRKGTKDNNSAVCESDFFFMQTTNHHTMLFQALGYKKSVLFYSLVTPFSFKDGLWKLAMILRPISASAPLAFIGKGL